MSILICTFVQKIKTVEIGGKTVKLQIVSPSKSIVIFFISNESNESNESIESIESIESKLTINNLVGYCRPRAIPDHYVIILPRRARRGCGLRRDQPRLV